MPIQTLTHLEAMILNIIADDAENLEHIYQSLSLEFSSEAYQSSDASAFYWRKQKPSVSLSDIAETLLGLILQELVIVHLEDSHTKINGLEYMWRGWFGLSPLGKSILVHFNESHDACSRAV
jgi:hypothetical protein